MNSKHIEICPVCKTRTNMITQMSKINRIIKKVQRHLKLNSYKISCFLKKNKDNSKYGEIDCDLLKRKAVITLNKRSLNDNLEDTIIHELLHLFLYKYLGVAESAFEKQKKLKKYLEGEEKAINILSSLLKRSIFSKRLQ